MKPSLSRCHIQHDETIATINTPIIENVVAMDEDVDTDEYVDTDEANESDEPMKAHAQGTITASHDNKPPDETPVENNTIQSVVGESTYDTSDDNRNEPNEMTIVSAQH
jgi:hypothetical protein